MVHFGKMPWLERELHHPSGEEFIGIAYDGRPSCTAYRAIFLGSQRRSHREASSSGARIRGCWAADCIPYDPCTSYFIPSCTPIAVSQYISIKKKVVKSCEKIVVISSLSQHFDFDLTGTAAATAFLGASVPAGSLASGTRLLFQNSYQFHHVSASVLLLYEP